MDLFQRFSKKHFRQSHLPTCFNNRHTTIHILDDLGDSIYQRGFGDGFHEGIVSLMFHSSKCHALTHAEYGKVKTVLGGTKLDLTLQRIPPLDQATHPLTRGTGLLAQPPRNVPNDPGQQMFPADSYQGFATDRDNQPRNPASL